MDYNRMFHATNKPDCGHTMGMPVSGLQKVAVPMLGKTMALPSKPMKMGGMAPKMGAVKAKGY